MINIFLLGLISLSALGAPKEIEVWFISNNKTAMVRDLLSRPEYTYRNPTAELKCQEMGDYCFDPQHGLYKKDDANGEIVETTKIATEGPTIPSGKSIDRDVVNCDSKNYFDLFCGKASGKYKDNSRLDVWIDTSSSMREFDFTEKDGSCYRKTLAKALDQECGFNQRVNVMMFDTIIKQAGTIDQLCTNQGLNDYKRLMDWVERSEAKKLVIITDIYELHKEFSDFIESKNGIIRGDKEPLTAKQMLELADQLAKTCK